MNLKINFLLFIRAIVLYIFFVCPILSQAQDTTFDKMVDKFQRGLIFQGTFNHRYIDSYTQDTVESKGFIWLAEEKYKIVSEQQSIVVDNLISRVYDEDRNRLIISTYDPADDDFAPSRFLNGVDSTYVITREEKQNEHTVITLESTDPFSIFIRVEIIVNRQLIPIQIFARDQAENEITTYFTDGRFIPADNEIFQLKYPDSAEIIDMRN